MASDTTCSVAFVNPLVVPRKVLDMASTCAGPSSKMSDEDSTKDAASCYPQLLDVCNQSSSSSSSSGDDHGNESNRSPRGKSSNEEGCGSDSGVTDTEQPVAVDPTCERVQCTPVPYDQGHADSESKSGYGEIYDYGGPAVNVPYDPEGTDSAVESVDGEFEDGDDHAAIVSCINLHNMYPPCRPPAGQ